MTESTMIYPETWGAVADNAFDCTAAIQAALDYAGQQQRSTTVKFGPGTYKITNTLLIPPKVNIEGSFGNYFGNERFCEVSWYGPAGENIIEFTYNGQNRSVSVSDIVLRNGSGHTDRPMHGLVIKDRADMWCCFNNFQVSGVNGNGVRFERGGINVHCKNFRFDACGSHGVFWAVAGFDNCSFDGFTVDNNRPDLATGGGAIHFDLTGASQNSWINCTVENAKIEINTNLPQADGAILFSINDNLSNRDQINAHINNLTVNPGTGVTSYTGLRVLPEWDWVKFVITNSLMSVSGIPSYFQAELVSTQNHDITVISPHSKTVSLAPGSSQTLTAITGDTNSSNYYQHGKQVGNAILATPTDAHWNTNPITALAGMSFLDPSTVNNPVRYVKTVSVAGTLGVLSGVVCSGVAGSSVISVNSVSTMKIGHHITIGTDLRRIIFIKPTTKEITLNSALSATITDCPVSFTPPTVVSHQLLTKRSGPPSSGGPYLQGDMLFNSTPSASSKIGWVCVVGGYPGTWKQFGAIDA